MTNEHINNLILLIFSDNKEDYKLGVNMIHAAEYNVQDLETIAKHCTNLLVNNTNKTAEVYVLLCSMGKLLSDISDDAMLNANILKKWIGNYNSVLNQINPPAWDYPTAGTGTYIGPLLPQQCLPGGVTRQYLQGFDPYK